MASVKRNYIYNLLNTVTGLLFPLLTFPYASRIMLADGIGQVNFYSSIIAYISLFSSLGIPLYAIREIAKVRDNKVLRDRTATEILLLHLILTALGYIIVLILAATVTKIQVDLPLYFIVSTSILFTAMGCEWFYKGIEDFKYITIRGLTVKIICVALLFLLVHTKKDLLLYGLYTVVGVVGNNVFNFFRLRKYISNESLCLRELKPLHHLKPALHIFILNIIISIYINLDTVMLGLIKDTTAVGYYTGATKLTKMLLGIVSSLSTVMIPRLSNLIAMKQTEDFNKLSEKATRFVIALTFPLTIGLFILGPTLIHLFCGPSYEPAIKTIQIICPIILVIGLSNVLGIQILYPQGKENLVIISTAVGAVLNFSFNWVLIPHLAQDGAAIATVIAETSVTTTMIIIGHKFIPFRIFSTTHARYLIPSILMASSLCCVQLAKLPDMLNLVICLIVGVVIYASTLLILKDSLFLEMLHSLKRNKSTNV